MGKLIEINNYSIIQYILDLLIYKQYLGTEHVDNNAGYQHLLSVLYATILCVDTCCQLTTIPFNQYTLPKFTNI